MAHFPFAVLGMVDAADLLAAWAEQYGQDAAYLERLPLSVILCISHLQQQTATLEEICYLIDAVWGLITPQQRVGYLAGRVGERARRLPPPD